MAPSQHIRTQHIPSTLGSRRRTAPIVLLLGASLLVSGCGGARQSATAAVVNETVVSEKDVQTVTRQLNSQNRGGQPYTTSDALVGLILVPFVFAEGNRQRKIIPDEQVLKGIGKVANPTVSTANFVKMQLLLGQLDPASQNLVGTQLGKAKIVVNPRYGTYLPQQGLVPSSPNWIKVSTPPVAR